MESFTLTKTILFVFFSLLLLYISRKALVNPMCHGFYRYFAFLGVIFLFLHNYPFWFDRKFDLHQMVSWVLLFTSILFVIQGLYMIRKFGGSAPREITPENFPFENTTHLVSNGIFRYIRHPMYSSLLLLTWGTFLKHVNPFTLTITIFTTIFLVIAGIIEEDENICFFGPIYLEYRKTTKMFIPFVV